MEVTIETQSEHKEKVQQVYTEVAKVVVGQEYMVNRLLIGLFTNGHVLLEGVPGLAKTLTISTLAQVLHLEFQRIQFTPDLLPADLVGTMIYNQKDGKFEVKKGPIFANIILADEINRSPAKVQSALLEAMQEKQVTIGETTFTLDKPFLVMATQNPVDQEMEIMRRISNMQFDFTVGTVLSKDDIFAIRNQINKVKISESLERYIIELVYATRNPLEYKLNEEAQYIQFGASPRASINLNLSAKALAYMEGRDYVLPEDIKEVARDVMNHRIILNYEAEADNVRTADIIKAILNRVPINK
jgi:MoxR-like ATPase